MRFVSKQVGGKKSSIMLSRFLRLFRLKEMSVWKLNNTRVETETITIFHIVDVKSLRHVTWLFSLCPVQIFKRCLIEMSQH